MEQDQRDLELRIFARRITWAIVLVGGLLFAGGLRLSGVDFDDLERKGARFKPGPHICLRTEWLETTVGEKDRAPFCIEWIDLADTSGTVHTMAMDDLEIVKDSGGKIRARHQNHFNGPLIGIIVFLAVLILAGKRIQRSLIKRKMIRLGMADSDRSD